MNPVYEKLNNCYESVKGKLPFEPKVALVLGSGLGKFAEEIDVKQSISYSEIEGFPTSTVPGHAGQYVFGYVDLIIAGFRKTAFVLEFPGIKVKFECDDITVLITRCIQGSR